MAKEADVMSKRSAFSCVRTGTTNVGFSFILFFLLFFVFVFFFLVFRACTLQATLEMRDDLRGCSLSQPPQFLTISYNKISAFFLMPMYMTASEQRG